MHVVLTGAACPLGRALLADLVSEHQVRGGDLVPPPDQPQIQLADVTNPAHLEALLAGCEAVVHLAQAGWDAALPAPANEARILDTRLKGTDALLRAAVAAGVRRVVQVSDLAIYSGYPPGTIVQEDFVPLPDASAHQQAVYLSELIGREYSRQHPGLVLTLRLGQLQDARQLPPQAVWQPDWLDVADAVAAIRRGLELQAFDGLAHWGVYNLVGNGPGARSRVHKIQSGHFRFTPRQDFAAWRREGKP